MDFTINTNIFIFIFQFFRSFPGPPDVTEADMTLLVQKYRDPDRPGLLNYLNLHHDIVAIGEQMAKDRELIEAPCTQVDNTHVMVSFLSDIKIMIMFFFSSLNNFV